jgi:hypothetical protein
MTDEKPWRLANLIFEPTADGLADERLRRLLIKAQMAGFGDEAEML